MREGDSFFVDSNVLIYGFGANSPVAKQIAAHHWITQLWSYRVGRISWQVIFEFYSNAIRKSKLSSVVSRHIAEELVLWGPETPTQAILERAWHWCDHAQINFWDALILAAAEQAGCRWLLTEDFQTGRTYAGVTVISPFTSSPGEFGLA